ncbi:MAG: Fe2+-dependent dioxygenase [Gammaproteobacteria bacterium]
MILSFPDVLTADELAAIHRHLAGASFISGQITAGPDAAPVKHNLQLDHRTPPQAEINAIVLNALRRHALFRAAVQPKQLHSLLVARYEPGMNYGLHVDNALMGSDHLWRSDVSLTIGLQRADQYQGGELVIAGANGELRYKPDAGTAICYPSTRLHRVEAVTAGVRLVIVAWIQSLVRDPAAREILYDLDQVRRALFAQAGKTAEFDLLCKTHANLLRRWAEP